MGAQRRTAHADARRLARRRTGEGNRIEHERVELDPQKRLQRRVAVREAHRRAARREPHQGAGPLGGPAMEGRNVLDMMAVPERVQVVRRHRPVRPDARRQQAGRPERGGAGLDLAHPADRVVHRRVEGRNRQRRNRAEHGRRRIDARRVRRRVGQRDIDRPAVRTVRDPRGRPEHGPRARAQRRDLHPQGRVGTDRRDRRFGRRSGRLGDGAGAPRLAEPPAQPDRQPGEKAPCGARPPDMPRLGPHPGRGGARPPNSDPAVPPAPDRPRDATDAPEDGAGDRAGDGTPPQDRRGQRPHLAELGYRQPRAPGAVQCRGPGDRYPRTVREQGRRHRRIAQRAAQRVHQPGPERGAGGQHDMERRHRKRVERRAPRRTGSRTGGRRSGGDPHPRLPPETRRQRSERVLAPPLRRRDPHHQVARPIAEQRLDRAGEARRRRVPGLHGHHVARHRVDPPRPSPPKPRIRDQPGELRALQRLVARLVRPALGEAPLVPGEGAALRRQQPAAHLHPVAELGVLPAIAREGLVEAADRLEEGPRDPQIVPRHRPEQVVVPRGQIPGPGHVALPPRRIEGPVAQQLPDRPGPVADRFGVDAGRRHVRAEAQRQRVGDRVVPARMRRQQPRLRDHVAVEKHQDGVRRRPRPGIARPRQAEPAPRLAHQLHLERSGDGQGGEPERRLRAVVDDHDLEQRARPVLPRQPGERQRQRIGRLEAGHDDADRQRRR